MADWSAILTQIDLILVDPQTIKYKQIQIDGKSFTFNSLAELLDYRNRIQKLANMDSGNNLAKVSFRGRVTQ